MGTCMYFLTTMTRSQTHCLGYAIQIMGVPELLTQLAIEGGNDSSGSPLYIGCGLYKVSLSLLSIHFSVSSLLRLFVILTT